jgi:hypothetical protein
VGEQNLGQQVYPGFPLTQNFGNQSPGVPEAQATDTLQQGDDRVVFHETPETPQAVLLI